MRLVFEVYKEPLFESLLEQNHQDNLKKIIDQLNGEGYSKKEIYELFLQFHIAIQIDPRTKDNEMIYDNLCDFMDGFTAWGKQHKTLPHEPDV